MEENVFSDPKKRCKRIFSLAWSIMFTEYGKALVLNVLVMGNTFFFDPKS